MTFFDVWGLLNFAIGLLVAEFIICTRFQKRKYFWLWVIVGALPALIVSFVWQYIPVHNLWFASFKFLLIFALRPGAGEFLWLVLIPAVLIMFSCVYGITVNLHFPVLAWDSEVRIVKQSAASMLGGMGGLILALLCAAAVGSASPENTGYLKAGICAAVLVVTGVLYRRNNRFDICGKLS